MPCTSRDRFGSCAVRTAGLQYSPPPATPRDASLVEQLRAADIPTFFLGAKSHWGIGGSLKKLRSHLEQQRPHVVQSFLFHANCLATWARPRDAALVLGVRWRIPHDGDFGWNAVVRREPRTFCVSAIRCMRFSSGTDFLLISS